MARRALLTYGQQGCAEQELAIAVGGQTVSVVGDMVFLFTVISIATEYRREDQAVMTSWRLRSSAAR